MGKMKKAQLGAFLKAARRIGSAVSKSVSKKPAKNNPLNAINKSPHKNEILKAINTHQERLAKYKSPQQLNEKSAMEAVKKTGPKKQRNGGKLKPKASNVSKKLGSAKKSIGNMRFTKKKK